ncbi:MAG: hypothetical protein KGO96_07340 [Elusimicrobia bacterium]|nr:hypothetical protein [Elusimicrobiota bacterium]
MYIKNPIYEINNFIVFLKSFGYKIVNIPNFLNSNTKVYIECNNKHKYETIAKLLIKGCRCKECYRASMRKPLQKVVEYFVKEGYEILDHSNYSGLMSKIITKCPKNHKYIVTINNFIKGYRCKKCSQSKEFKMNSLRHKKLIEKVYKITDSEKYKIMFRPEYLTVKDKIKLLCPKEHIWDTIVSDFLGGHRCSHCSYILRGENKRTPLENVIYEFFKNGYTILDHSMYKNIHSKLLVLCPYKHKIYKNFKSFKNGYRCEICFHKHSVPELEIYNFVKYFYSDSLNGFKIPKSRFELDIYIPSLNKAIEFDGTYWHSQKNLNYRPERDLFKNQQCKESGIDLLRIKEEDYKENKEFIFRLILAFLNNTNLNNEEILGV